MFQPTTKCVDSLTINDIYATELHHKVLGYV